MKPFDPQNEPASLLSTILQSIDQPQQATVPAAATPMQAAANAVAAVNQLATSPFLFPQPSNDAGAPDAGPAPATAVLTPANANAPEQVIITPGAQTVNVPTPGGGTSPMTVTPTAAAPGAAPASLGATLKPYAPIAIGAAVLLVAAELYRRHHVVGA